MGTLTHLGNLPLVQGTVDELGVNTVGFQRIHLVFHQRDKGGDDQGEAVQGQRRQLVTEGLAAASGHEDKGVFPVHHRADDLFLQRQEPIEAEVSLQQIAHGSILPKQGHLFNS